MNRQRLPILTPMVLLLCLGLASVRADEVSFNIYANSLKTAGGSAMPVSGLVILVASTTDSTFGGPTTSGFVSGDDIELARFDLSSTANPGELFAAANGLVLSGSWGANDPLALYWFPTQNVGSATPTNGTPFGYYRDLTSGLDGSDPWLTPAGGATISLNFITTDAGGSSPSTAGRASFTVSAGNSAPVANPDIYQRGKDLSVKVKLSDLLTNDTDANPDTLAVYSVSALSTNNIVLTNDGTNVYYSASAPNVNDQFTYTLTDGHVLVNGIVTIQAVTSTGTNSIISLQVGVPGGGTNTIQFAGVPGFSYISQFATNVSGPWVPFSTNTAGTNGLWSVTDTTATNVMRFYRTVY